MVHVERRSLLEGDSLVKWVATDEAGNVVGELHIIEEEVTVDQPRVYTIRYGFHDGQETVIQQRQISVPRWQSLNIMGMLYAALSKLDYLAMCSDAWPMDQYEREEGQGSAIPVAFIERTKRQ